MRSLAELLVPDLPKGDSDIIPEVVERRSPALGIRHERSHVGHVDPGDRAAVGHRVDAANLSSGKILCDSMRDFHPHGFVRGDSVKFDERISFHRFFLSLSLELDLSFYTEKSSVDEFNVDFDQIRSARI